MARFAVRFSLAALIRSLSRLSSSLKLESPLVPVLAIFLSLTGVALSQTNTPLAGVLPFSTQVGGPYDSFDLASSNVLVTIPVRNKVGKIPFSFDLVGNSRAWVWVLGQLKPQWVTSAENWWSYPPYNGIAQFFLQGVPIGTLGMTMSVGTETGNCNGNPDEGQEGNLAVIDSFGTVHPMPANMVIGTGGCAPTSATGLATDGSGYTLHITSGASSFVTDIYDRSGNHLHNDLYNSPTTYTLYDPDGASISYYWPPNGATTYTDSLGTTALTSSAPPVYANGTYTYLGGDGNPNDGVSVQTQSFHQKTVFNCSGISDIDAAGTPFPTSVTIIGAGTFTFTYETTPGYAQNSGYVTGRIQTITYPSGGSVTYGYAGGNNGINCTSQVVPTLTRAVYDNYSNTTTTYTYLNSNSGSSPNYTVTEYYPYPYPNSNNNKTTHYFSGEFETERIVTDVNLGTLSTTQICYGSNSTPPKPPYCVSPSSTPQLPITETDVYTSLGTSSNNEVQKKFDAYGNLLSLSRYDWGSSSPASVLSISYSGSGCTVFTNYIYDRPCVVQVADSQTRKYESATYTSTGHVLTTSTWANGTNYGHTSYTYNQNGTLSYSTETDNNIVTQYSYADSSSGGCSDFLLTGITYPLANVGSSSQTWDCNGGVITSQTDVNSNPTYFYYVDPLYRLTKTIYPDSPADYTTTTYQTGTSFPWTITTDRTSVDPNNPTRPYHQYTFDGLDRMVSVQAYDPNSTNGHGYSTQATTYDIFGRVSSVGNPYFVSNEATSGTTSYTYDAIGRTLKVTNADNTYRTNTYANRAVVSTDESNIQRVYQVDGLGRLQYVCEGIGATTQANNASPSTCAQGQMDYAASGFLSTYTYDGADRLIKAAVGTSSNWPTAQNRTFNYDGLDRLTSETNPEVGTVTYTYDSPTQNNTVPWGMMNSKTFPNQNGTTGTVSEYFSWDNMYRPTGVAFSTGSTALSYTYDLSKINNQFYPSNPKGRLVEQTNSAASSSQIYSYDSMGRLNQTWQNPNNAGWVQTAFNRNFLGLPTTVTDAQAKTFTYSYNAIGQKTGVSSSDTSGALWSSAAYNALGELTQATFGGLQRVLTYDHRGRQLTVTDGESSSPTYYDSLSYYGNNSVYTDYEEIAPPPPGGIINNLTFTYDSFGRLATSVNTGTGNNYSYSYDQFGNRWKQTVTAGSGLTVLYNFDGNNHSSCCRYSASGNVIDDGNVSYSYDNLGELTGVGGEGGNGSGDGSAQFDAMGNRVGVYDAAANNQINFVLWPDGTPQFASGNGSLLFEKADRVLTYVGAPYQYWVGAHEDHLGAPKVTTKQSDGSWYSQEWGLPFGDGTSTANGIGWQQTGPNSDYRGFAGSFWDGLKNTNGVSLNDDHFGAREYSKNEGHWLTPDPSGLASVDITNPQTWNKYAYVTNNPVSEIDPSGLYKCDPLGATPCGQPPCYMCGGAGGPGYGDYGGTSGEGGNSPSIGSGAPGDPMNAPPFGVVLGVGGPCNFLCSLLSGGVLGSVLGSSSAGSPCGESVGLPCGVSPAPSLPCGFAGCGAPIGNGFGPGLVLAGAGTVVCEIAEPCGLVEDATLLAALAADGLLIHYFGRQQSNEWTDMAKQFAPQDPCAWLAAQKSLPQNQDSATQGKIVQAQKYLGCRNISKRN